MLEFLLNGEKVQTEKNENLLEFLREDTRNTSVKNGCGEGACGACMVILDGKAMRACLLTTEKINGKSVVTTEGLSERERRIFAWAFATEGAVQCGFCIPGMVMSAKALIDVNNNPTPQEVKNAIRGNVCRCTGYIKIESAILKAAKAFREGTEPPLVECKGLVGEKFPRVDAEAKTLGTGKYVDDLNAKDLGLEELLYGGAVRLSHARVLVKGIDASEALKHPGVVAVLTADDIPGKRYIGHLVKDWPALVAIGEETRCVGDGVALVAATSKKALKEAIKLVKVDYEVLKPVTCPQEAMKEDAPKLHEGGNVLRKEVLKRGNVDEIIANSKYVTTNEYFTPFTEHAFLEPECAVAVPDGDDKLVLYTASQSVYDEKREISELLDFKNDELRCISMLVGGGFGGKEDMSVQHHAALLAWKLKRPVKVLFSRQESINIHSKRHAMWMTFTTACDENGKLTAMKARVIADTGAYASLGGPVLQRACTHAAGPYNYQNIDIEGSAIYTNNPPAGAFRGFGVTQTAFATECNINKLAEMVGISTWEMRFRNAIEPGQVLSNGQIAGNDTALKETLLAVKEEFDNNKNVGIACAFKNSGVGVGIPDTGRCILVVKDGKIHIRTSAACIGQGLATIVTQMVCQTIGVSPENVYVQSPDTNLTPNSGTTTASRQTVFTGEATRVAAMNLKEALENNTLEELEGKEFYGEYSSITDPMGSDKENPVSHVAYGYATQLVVLDDDGKLVKVLAAHDVGRSINPIAVEGQIEGGVVMGLGYALKEDYPLKDSIPMAKFGTLGLLRSTDVPEVRAIIIEKSKEELAYGGKGVGEIVVIPTAPAVQGAYYKLDGKFRTRLPLEDTAYKKVKK